MSAIKVPSQFISHYYEIDKIMKQYIHYLAQIKIQGQPFLLPYNTHIIVRAFETLFYDTFTCASGAYVSARSGEIKVGDSKKPDFSHRAQSHSWLELKEDPKFILDVVPVYGVLGLSPVIPILREDNLFGYISSGDVDPKHWTPPQKQKCIVMLTS